MVTLTVTPRLSCLCLDPSGLLAFKVELVDEAGATMGERVLAMSQTNDLRDEGGEVLSDVGSETADALRAVLSAWQTRLAAALE